MTTFRCDSLDRNEMLFANNTHVASLLRDLQRSNAEERAAISSFAQSQRVNPESIQYPAINDALAAAICTVCALTNRLNAFS